MQNRGDEPVGEIISLLWNKADALYRFVMLYYDYVMEKNDYGTGEYLNMAEAHTLMRIVQSPGITVSQLALDTNRTKSSLSQTVKSLGNMGYVQKSSCKEDGRVAKIYATEKGHILNDAHRLYDSFEVSATFEELLRYCKMEDIDSFFRVVDAYIAIITEELKNGTR